MGIHHAERAQKKYLELYSTYSRTNIDDIRVRENSDNLTYETMYPYFLKEGIHGIPISGNMYPYITLPNDLIDPVRNEPAIPGQLWGVLKKEREPIASYRTLSHFVDTQYKFSDDYAVYSQIHDRLIPIVDIVWVQVTQSPSESPQQ